MAANHFGSITSEGLEPFASAWQLNCFPWCGSSHPRVGRMRGRRFLMIGTILLILLIILLLGAIPTWPHSRSWGYGPVGGLGLVLLIVVVLLLTGRL